MAYFYDKQTCFGCSEFRGEGKNSGGLRPPLDQVMFLLQCLHELPDGRMVTTQHAVEPLMPPLCNIGGSRQPHKGGIMLIQ